MESKMAKMDWLFLGLCLLLGILAEESFFRGQIGISYLVFLFAFYAVFFWRYRRFSFTHQRFGYLVLCCIWLLAASYFLNDNMFFNVLNIIVIPALVVFHIVIVTSPKSMQWNKIWFIPYLFFRLLDAIKYNAAMTKLIGSGVKRGVDEDKFIIWKKVFIGILISIPVLFVVLSLLMSADTQFERIMGGIPNWFNAFDAEGMIRLIVILIFTAAFFGFMQVLIKKQIEVIKQPEFQQGLKVDAIITITVLCLINIVYLVFTVVQFKYFFSGTLQGDYTYAEYARKGFFELLFVTIINLSIIVVVLTFVGLTSHFIKRFTQILLTLLVFSSAVMLCSAFIRLSMYEDAYGFTFIRVMAHSFMIFLVFIFTYTLVKVWIERLSLFHFFFISSLLYYTVMTVIDPNQIVVSKNLDRYELTGKIDVHHFDSLSYTGVLGLIDLYEKDKNIESLTQILEVRQKEALTEDASWQSYNLKREQAFMELRKLNFK
ncbi:DUF4173 domain-containing protein [Bacillus sp. FJAT-29953]|nr:DUF4173 domain-containing protein [Bacillus sp. FJAT-29953]